MATVPPRLSGRERLWAAMPERDLQASIEQLLEAAGWLHYHAPDNRPGPDGSIRNVKAGFPDLVTVDPGGRGRPGPRLVALELKRQTRSNPTPDQLRWLGQFARLGAYVAVIRPSHLHLVQAVIVRHAPWPDVDPATLEPTG